MTLSQQNLGQNRLVSTSISNLQNIIGFKYLLFRIETVIKLTSYKYKYYTITVLKPYYS